MNISLTWRELVAVRNRLNGDKHCDEKAEATAKKKFESRVQVEAAKMVKRIVGKKAV
jgi:hypothetical protein